MKASHALSAFPLTTRRGKSLQNSTVFPAKTEALSSSVTSWLSESVIITI